MTDARLLIIEDDAGLSETLRDLLSETVTQVRVATDGPGGLREALSFCPDLILLDLNLPGLPGLLLLKELSGHLPACKICIISSAATVEERVAGLREGADDYLVKPFSVAELTERVGALLRRGRLGGASLWVWGDLRLRADTRSVECRGARILLTGTESRLLAYLLSHPRRTVTRDELLDELWAGKDRYPNIVDAHIESLRTKLNGAWGGNLIRTVYGLGYALNEPVFAETS